MQRVAVTAGGIIVLVLVAAGLTEATLALGHRGSLANDVLLRPLGLAPASPTPVPAATASPKPSASPTPVATPVPTPAPIAGPKATTNGFVHLRGGKGVTFPILIDLNAGTVVSLLSDSDSQWQQVNYNGTVGYIFKSYLTY